MIVASKTADTFEEAVDLCLDALEKQLEKIKEKYLVFCSENGRKDVDVHVTSSVHDALSLSKQLAAGETAPLVYIGGSTYVVSEAVSVLMK